MIVRLLGQYWPFLVIALLAGLGYWQFNRANDAEALAASRQETIGFQSSIITSYATAIENQNTAIRDLAERREEGRVIYLQDYARADQSAKAFDLRANQLLAQKETFTDELAECRATKALLEQELLP